MANGKIKAYKVVIPITSYVVWVECAESEEKAIENVQRDIAMRIGRGWGSDQIDEHLELGKPYVQKEL